MKKTYTTPCAFCYELIVGSVIADSIDNASNNLGIDDTNTDDEEDDSRTADFFRHNIWDEE